MIEWREPPGCLGDTYATLSVERCSLSSRYGQFSPGGSLTGTLAGAIEVSSKGRGRVTDNPDTRCPKTVGTVRYRGAVPVPVGTVGDRMTKTPSDLRIYLSQTDTGQVGTAPPGRLSPSPYPYTGTGDPGGTISTRWTA